MTATKVRIERRKVNQQILSYMDRNDKRWNRIEKKFLAPLEDHERRIHDMEQCVGTDEEKGLRKFRNDINLILFGDGEKVVGVIPQIGRIWDRLKLGYVAIAAILSIVGYIAGTHLIEMGNYLTGK